MELQVKQSPNAQLQGTGRTHKIHLRVSMLARALDQHEGYCVVPKRPMIRCCLGEGGAVNDSDPFLGEFELSR